MGRRFRITVTGRLGAEFLAAFDEVRLRYRGPDTEIRGTALDQAHLDGMLAHLRDLGLQVTDLRTRDDPRRRSGPTRIHVRPRATRGRS